MSEILNKNIVLVLNRNWQAINVSSPAAVFSQMATDTATALDIDEDHNIRPVKWDEWLTLSVRDDDLSLGTVRGRIRVPTVVVLANFAKVPKKRPKFSPRAIRERDGGRCQYTGRLLGPDEGNIDHVIPRSRGGHTTWNNCVWACKDINSRKGSRTPDEAGLKLVRSPASPAAVPVTYTLRNFHGISDWNIFLPDATA